MSSHSNRAATRSALWCVGCEGVIRIAGIHKIGTGGAQQSLTRFYDMKIAARDLSDYLIGFRVLASVRRRGPDLDGN
jgi:hypothetical protein